MRVFAASSIRRFGALKDLFIDLEQIRFCRPVRTPELHLTFRFFGEIAGKNLDIVLARFKEIPGKKFAITLDGLGAFPVLERTNVLFLKVVPSEEINHNWSSIGAIDPKEVAKKEFIPHITVARFKKPFDCTNLAEKYGNVKFTAEIDRISLYSSTLTTEGPVYSVIESVQLK